MSWIDALILGVIQGFSEFFPISSSAHLTFTRLLLKTPANLYFDLICHLGTLLAAIYFLRQKIAALFQEKKKILYLMVAILPLLPAYLLCKPLLKLLSTPKCCSLFLIFTSFLLFLTSSLPMKKDPQSTNRKIKDMLFIGFMQTLALIPGISRCGSTIFAASFQGWKLKEAISFSFLLAIPTIMGGSIVEAFLVANPEVSMTSPLNYLVGFIASFIVGLFAARFIFSLVDRKKIKPFAWYCLIIGVISFLYINRVTLQ